MISCCKKAEVISNPLTSEWDLSSLKGLLISGEKIYLKAIFTEGQFGIETKKLNDSRSQLIGFSILTKIFELAKSGYFKSLKSAKRLKIGTWKFSEANCEPSALRMLSAELKDLSSKAL